MRKVRELAENVWYMINTSANNGELLFESEFGVWLFGRTVSEAKERYTFELRRVRMHGVVLYQACQWAAIAGYYEVQMCGLIGMMGGRGTSGAPKVARETLSVLLYPGSTAGP